MKVSIHTLGCKVNQNESAALEALFAAAGYTAAAPGEVADVYVVNSCTVTAGADAKARAFLRRARRQNPAAVTVLTGCFPQAFPTEVFSLGADVVSGTAGRGRLPQLVGQFLATGAPVVDIAQHTPGERFEDLPTGHMPGRTRAFVKIEDGCDGKCAYCIIPTARGPVRSRPRESILAELAAHAAAGTAEVVFTGINLPSYGRDTGDTLGGIVGTAGGVPGIRRIRLSSLDPHRITPDEIARFAAAETLCRQFHLSLQSGCDATLARMRRPYTTASYRAAARALADQLPGATFTTDVIVGFPGETDAEFAQSLAFVESMQFLKVHVFPFSARPGTPAADFPGQLPKAEKAARADAMQTAADAVRTALIARQAGTTQEVLLETPLPDGRFTGYTAGYIPVVVAAPGARQGDIIRVTLGTFDGERCAATALPPP